MIKVNESLIRCKTCALSPFSSPMTGYEKNFEYLSDCVLIDVTMRNNPDNTVVVESEKRFQKRDSTEF